MNIVAIEVIIEKVADSNKTLSEVVNEIAREYNLYRVTVQDDKGRTYNYNDSDIHKTLSELKISKLTIKHMPEW